MLPIRHCRCGSAGCVWSVPADSSELCLPRGPCHKRCKHIQSAAYSVRLSVSAAYSLSVCILKFNQPSIASFILVRWACTSFHFWWALLKAVVLYVCSLHVMYSVLWHYCTELHNPMRVSTHQASVNCQGNQTSTPCPVIWHVIRACISRPIHQMYMSTMKGG